MWAFSLNLAGFEPKPPHDQRMRNMAPNLYRRLRTSNHEFNELSIKIHFDSGTD